MSTLPAGRLERALQGDRDAVRALVVHLTPPIQARIARLLLRRGGGRSIRAELEDMVQDVLVVLFAEDAKVLRAWRADGGLSLEGYAALVAERRARSKLRTRKGNPWTETPLEAEKLARRRRDTPGPEGRAAAKQELRTALARLREELTPQAYRLFELLWVEERSVEAICEELSMKRDAVYQGKRRIRKVADRIAAEIRDGGETREPGR